MQSAPRFPSRLLAGVVLLSIAVLVWLGISVFLEFGEDRASRRTEFRIAELAGEIVLYDQVLTMSARMAAATGDGSWEPRYRATEKKLDAALAEAKALSPDRFLGHAADETRKANEILLAMENRVFALVRHGRATEARDLIDGESYHLQKERYRRGMIRFQLPRRPELLLENLRSKILFYDEILTMSARMAAATGDLRWEARYRTIEAELDSSLYEARLASKEREGLEATAQTDAANRALVDMENRAFKLVKEGRKEEALSLLLSDRYNAQKVIYAQGMDRLDAHMADLANASIARAERRAMIRVMFAAGAVFLLGALFFVTLKGVQRWRKALSDARDNLELRVHERTAELTHEIQLRERLQDHLVESKKWEAVGTLARGVSHEFNNLMMVVGGNSQILLQQMGNGGERSLVEEIRSAGDRAALLTSQLMAFSREQSLQPELVDLNDILIGAGSFLKSFAGEKTRIETSPERGLSAIRVDPAQLNQTLVNLVLNARDAMPDGGTLTIEAANVNVDTANPADHRRIQPGSYVMLKVRDTGLGMDPGTLSRIFEPFFTTKDPGEGVGLGLSMVQGVVQQSGGHVWASSEKGKGTTIHILFPRAGEAL